MRAGQSGALAGPRARSLLLEPWGFALTAAFEPAGQSAGSWRVHHDALAHLFYGDAMRAGVEGRTEPHGLFADSCHAHVESSTGCAPAAAQPPRRPKPAHASV